MAPTSFGTAALVATWLVLGTSSSLGTARSAALAAVAATLSAAAVIDVRTHRLPNRALAAAGLCAVVGASASEWATANPASASARPVTSAAIESLRHLTAGVVTAAGGALVAGVPMLLARVSRRGSSTGPALGPAARSASADPTSSTASVGMGDVKAAAVIGASTVWLAWWAPFVAIAAAAAVAAAFGLAMRRQRLALGPFLVTGWALAVVSAVAVTSGVTR